MHVAGGIYGIKLIYDAEKRYPIGIQCSFRRLFVVYL